MLRRADGQSQAWPQNDKQRQCMRQGRLRRPARRHICRRSTRQRTAPRGRTPRLPARANILYRCACAGPGTTHRKQVAKQRVQAPALSFSVAQVLLPQKDEHSASPVHAEPGHFGQKAPPQPRAASSHWPAGVGEVGARVGAGVGGTGVGAGVRSGFSPNARTVLVLWPSSTLNTTSYCWAERS